MPRRKSLPDRDLSARIACGDRLASQSRRRRAALRTARAEPRATSRRGAGGRRLLRRARAEAPAPIARRLRCVVLLARRSALPPLLFGDDATFAAKRARIGPDGRLVEATREAVFRAGPARLGLGVGARDRGVMEE